MDHLPEFILLHLLSYCHDSYKSLRIVCRLFAALVPIIKSVKYHDFKILQPLKMKIYASDNFTPVQSLKTIKLHSYDYYNCDFSQFTNLRKIIAKCCEQSLIMPNNLEVVKWLDNCDLSSTKLKTLYCTKYGKSLATAPDTLTKLNVEKFHPCCDRFVNLEYLQTNNVEIDLTCFKKLKKIKINFDKKTSQLPVSIEHIEVQNAEHNLDFTYLPNLKSVNVYCMSNNKVRTNSGVKRKISYF